MGFSGRFGADEDIARERVLRVGVGRRRGGAWGSMEILMDHEY